MGKILGLCGVDFGVFPLLPIQQSLCCFQKFNRLTVLKIGVVFFDVPFLKCSYLIFVVPVFRSYAKRK